MKRFVLFAFLAVFVGCAHNTPKDLLVTGQTITGLLRIAQSAENQFCNVDPAQPSHCLATVPGVLPDKLDIVHQDLARLFVRAYTDDLVYIDAARQWQPGQSVPVSLSSLRADADQILTTLMALSVPDQAKSALAAAKALVDKIADRLAAYGK